MTIYLINNVLTNLLLLKGKTKILKRKDFNAMVIVSVRGHSRKSGDIFVKIWRWELLLARSSRLLPNILL